MWILKRVALIYFSISNHALARYSTSSVLGILLATLAAPQFSMSAIMWITAFLVCQSLEELYYCKSENSTAIHSTDGDKGVSPPPTPPYNGTNVTTPPPSTPSHGGNGQMCSKLSRLGPCFDTMVSHYKTKP